MLYSHILRNLNQLRLKNKFCDLQLLTMDGGVYSMHKCVFVAACKRQFDITCSRDSDLPMTKLCKMILPDISSNELEVVIGFIYGENVGDTDNPMLQEALAKLHMLDLLEELRNSETSNDFASQTCHIDLHVDIEKESEKSPFSTIMHNTSGGSNMFPLSDENGYTLSIENKEEPTVAVEVYQPDKDPLSASSDTQKQQDKETDTTKSISENRNRLNETGINLACGLQINPEIGKQNEISPQRDTVLHNISNMGSMPLLSSKTESVEIKEEPVVVDGFQNSEKEPQTVFSDVQKQKTAEKNEANSSSKNYHRVNEVDVNAACDLQVDPEIEKETDSLLQNDIMQNSFNYGSGPSLDKCNQNRDAEIKEELVVAEAQQSAKDTPFVSSGILKLENKEANGANINISDKSNRIACDSEFTMLKLECEELVNSEVISPEAKTKEDEKIDKLMNQISVEVELLKSQQSSQRTECATEIDITEKSPQKSHTWSDNCHAKTDTVSSLQIIDSHDSTAEHSLTKDSGSIEVQTDVVKDFSSVISCTTVNLSTCSSQQQAMSKMTPQSKYKMILPRVIPPSEFPTLSCLLSTAVSSSKPGQNVRTSGNRNIAETNTDPSYTCSSNLSNMPKCQSMINKPCQNTSNKSMGTEIMQHRTIATILALPPLISNRITETKCDIEARPECSKRCDWNAMNRKETKNSDHTYFIGNQDNFSETEKKGHEDEYTKEYRKKSSVDIKLTTGKIMMRPNFSEINAEPQREQDTCTCSLESPSQTLSCKLETVQRPPPDYKQKLIVKMKRNTESRGKKKNDSNKVLAKAGISAPLQALLKETSKNADSSPVCQIPVVNHLEQQTVKEASQSVSVSQNTQNFRTSSPSTLQTLLKETLKAVDSNPVCTTVTQLEQQTVQEPTKSISTLQNNGSIRTAANPTPLQASLKETSKDVDSSPICTAFDHQGKQALQAPTESVSTLYDNGNGRTPSPKDQEKVVGKDVTVQGISRKLTLVEQIHLQRNRKNKRKLLKPMKRLSRETEVVFDKTESSLAEAGKPTDNTTASLSHSVFENREINENYVKCAQLNARPVQDETEKVVTSESEFNQESNSDKTVVDMSITETSSVFTPEIISQTVEHGILSSKEKISITIQTDKKEEQTLETQSSKDKSNIGSISERSPEITKLLSRSIDDLPKFHFGMSQNVDTIVVPNCQFNKPGKQQDNPQSDKGLLPVQILTPEDSSCKHRAGNNVRNKTSDDFVKSTNSFIESEKLSEANLLNSECLSDLNKRKRNNTSDDAAKSTNSSTESERISEANHVNSICLSELSKRKRNKVQVRRHESPVKSYMTVKQLLQIKPKLPENNSTKTVVKCSRENSENKAITVSSRKRQLSLSDGLERFTKSKRIEMKTNNRQRGKIGKTVYHINEKKKACSCSRGSILNSNVGESVTFGIKEPSSNNDLVDMVDNDIQKRKANAELSETDQNTNDQQPENIPQQTVIVISPSLQGLMKCYERPLRFTPEQMVPSKYVEYDVTAPAFVHKLPKEKLPKEKFVKKLKKSDPQPVRSYRPIAPKKTDDKSSCL